MMRIRQFATVAAGSIIVAVGVGLIYYRGAADKNVVAAAAIGITAAVVVLPIQLRSLTNRNWMKERASSRFPYFETALFLVGLGLIAIGAVVGSTSVLLSGLPFIGLAASLALVKHLLARRGS